MNDKLEEELERVYGLWRTYPDKTDFYDFYAGYLINFYEHDSKEFYLNHWEKMKERDNK